MDLNQAMAINLRRIRHAHKLTQEELAHLAGLSTRYVGSIERTEVSPSLTVVDQIAIALAVEPSELLAKPKPRRG
jgi:transcriptional regulator with XRE-family HTH domain